MTESTGTAGERLQRAARGAAGALPGPGEGVTERMVVDAVEHSYDLVAGGLPSRRGV